MAEHDDLKRRARSLLPDNPAPATPLSSEAAAHLIQELRVHQIELELQNEELRHTEAQLLASRDRYRHLFDNAPVSYVVLDASTTIIEVNETFCRVLGHSRDRIVGAGIAEFLAKSDQHSFLSRFRAWMAKPAGKALEVSVVGADGARRRMQLGGVSTHGESDVILDALLLSLTDVSESHRLHQEVEAVRRELEELIESIPVGVFTYRTLANSAMSFEYASPLWCSQLGVDRESVLADSNVAMARLHPDDKTSFVAAHAAARKSGSQFRWEGRFIVRGETRWLRLSSTPQPLENGDTRWKGIQEDVTQRKKAELALREGQESFLSIVNTTLDGFLCTDSAGRLVDVNQRYCIQSGYSRAELMAMQIDLLTPDGMREHWMEQRKRILESGRAQFETTHLRRDGSTWHAEASATYLPVGGGRMFVFLRDITDRRKAREELERHKGRLENLVRLRTAELEQAKDVAEAANRAKSAFLANMSHELRTPINGVMGMTELALRHSADPKVADWLGKSKSAAMHLLSLVNNILDISKIEANQMLLEEKIFSPRSVLHDVIEMQKSIADAKGVGLTCDVAEDVPELLSGDPLRLSQILINFTSNAIKFSAQGDIAVRAFIQGATNQDVMLRVEVTDQGIGIEDAQLPQLFLPFVQGDSSTTRRYGGTGLGLNISKRIAEMMGGAVGVRSKIGEGSMFWASVKLRRSTTNASPLAHPHASERSALAGNLRGKRVLLVEDDPLNREVALLSLTELGLIVETANDGVDAVSAVLRSSFDLILMDIQMPNMNGLDATRAIRGMPNVARLPIIAMTANAFDEDRRACLEAGANEHLAKPVTADSLMACIGFWLNRSAM